MTFASDFVVSTGAGVALDEERAAAATKLFRKHGGLSMRGGFDPAMLRHVGERFLSQYSTIPLAELQRTCLEVGPKRFMFTVRIEGIFANPELYASPVVLPIVKRLLGEEAVIQSYGAMCAYPGAPMQHIHRDLPELFPNVAGLGTMLPPYALQLFIPLVDLDEDTGTTAYWEGSHRSERSDDGRRSQEPKRDDPELEGAALPYSQLGDSYTIDLRLRHRGTPNVSERPRPVLYLVYSRAWWTDHRNFDLQEPLVISPTELAAVPTDLQSLFRFARPS